MVITGKNVYFSGFAFGSNVKKIPETLNNPEYEVYFSFKLWSEITNIFVCEQLQKILKEKYDSHQTIQLLDFLQSNLKFKVTTTKIELCRDLKGNLILASEINADFMITGDKDLLTLNPFLNTKIFKPSQFLELL